MVADGSYAGSAPGVDSGMRLSHAPPKMTRHGFDALMKALRFGCRHCARDAVHGGSATLRRRTIKGGNETVEAQCDRCFESVSGAMTRGEHAAWQAYPEWDEQARTEFREAQERTWALARQARAQLAEQGIQASTTALREKREAYRGWTADDPDWKRLAGLVRKRAAGTCEACLSGPVEAIHHVSYHLGKLPPAFLLRGVCRGCHDRLHADRRGERDEWCPASMQDPEA